MEKQKHKATLLIAGLCLLNSSLLQAQAFRKGDNIISFGYGFGPLDHTDDIDFYNAKIDQHSQYIGPFYLKYENAVSRRTSFGLNLAYSFYNNTTDYSGYASTITPIPPVYESYREKDNHSVVTAIARINWHLGDNDKFDPYAGFGLGCVGFIDKSVYTDSLNGETRDTFKEFEPYIELTIGARYYFNDNLGCYAETGFSQSIVQLGLVYKIRR